MSMQRRARIVLVGAVAALLVGCAAVAPFGIPAFTQEQSTEDRLPAEVQSSSLESSSSRLLVEADDVMYFAVRSEGDICLVVFATTEIWGIGCSTGLPIDVALHGYPTARLESLAIESDTWQPIGDHISLEKPQ